MESNSGLKTAAITAGIRLELLSESPGGSVGESEESDWDPSAIQSRLRQTELDWSRLQLDLPVVLRQLHKVSEGLSVSLRARARECARECHWTL